MLVLFLAVISCDRSTGNSNVAKPTQVVAFPSMVGKSLQELTTMLGQPTPQVLCYNWELPEGKLNVCYEGHDGKKLMSSITYELMPDPGSASDRGVGSPAEMMALLNINVEGKEAEENRRGFFTYNDIRLNGKSCFVDIHRRSTNLVFGPRVPVYTVAQLYIRNPNIYLYSSLDLKGTETHLYEERANIDISVGSVLLGEGNWEVCTEPNFAGNCKILDGIGEYLEKRKNFSAFGIGQRIRSLRPVERNAK
ncbi:MAG: beta/gamma crystallin-related protein [Pyrinomonadaceae bacterium]